MSVALIILFNHNYEANLPRLDALYQKRFAHIYYAMPFYEGNRADVITVYDNSFYFQRYIADVLQRIRHHNFDHYLVIGDDLLLNPAINENNYKDFFQVSDTQGFLPGFFLLNDVNETRPNRNFAPYWDNNERIFDFTTKQKGINAQRFLPSYDEAKSLLEKHGIHFTPGIPKQMFFRKPLLKWPGSTREAKRNIRSLIIFFTHIQSIVPEKKLSYPMVGSYSDCLVIPNHYTDAIIRYFGVFSSLRLFVEAAIPTAMAFAIPRLTQEKDLLYKGDTYWLRDIHNKRIEDVEEKYNRSLDKLIEMFPEHTLYIHPIKLSRWK